MCRRRNACTVESYTTRPVVRVHARAVGIEDSGDLDLQPVLAPIIEEQGLGATLAFVIARARAYRVDVPPIIFSLRVDAGIAVDLRRRCLSVTRGARSWRTPPSRPRASQRSLRRGCDFSWVSPSSSSRRPCPIAIMPRPPDISPTTMAQYLKGTRSVLDTSSRSASKRQMHRRESYEAHEQGQVSKHGGRHG